MKKNIFILFFVLIYSSVFAASVVTKISNTDGTVINPSTSNNQTNGSHKTQIVDANGHTINAVMDEDGTYHLSVAVIQDVHIISSNSSTINLLSGATFTGTSWPTTESNSIQVSLKTDINARVYIEQSPDGINWDISDVYNYYYSVNNFGVTVQAINSYFRIRVSNLSSTSSTYFRLQSALCPIVEAVPRSLNADGNFKVKTYGIEDEYGFDVENTPNGEMRTVQPTLLVGKSFEGAIIDPNFWTVVSSSSGTVIQSSDTITMSTGTGANGTSTVNSVRRARYVPGQAHVERFQLRVGDTGVANNVRKWGALWGTTMPTITDGAYFQLSGTTFSIVTIKGGSASTVSSGSFNGKYGSSYSLDTNFHTYEIYWNNKTVFFTIDGEVLHTVRATTETWTNTVQFHIYFENTNSGGSTTNTSLTCSAAGIRRLGSLLSQPTSKYQSGTVAALVLKYGVGNVHGISISGVVNNSVVTLYDNTAATGTILWSSGAMSNQTVPLFIDLKGLPYFTGLTLAITVANSNVTVIYE